MSAIDRFCAWADRPDLNAMDLARYRVIYAVVALITLQNLHWFSAYPNSLFSPPSGPLQLFHGFIPLWLALTLEAVMACAIVLMGCGIWTVPASVAVTVLYTLLTAFTYSLGKINHTILLDLTPALMAAAGWSGRGKVRGWVLRLLAFIIGLAMLSAGLGKALTGWLDPHTHAVQGYMTIYRYQLENDAVFSRAVSGIHSGAFWELLDWSTVFVEASVVVAAFASWRLFRMSLAALALFHLGVWLTLGISFSSSILIYAAFVPWGRLRLPAWFRLPAIRWPAAVAIGIAAWGAVTMAGNAAWIEGPAALVAGGLVGVWFLASVALDLCVQDGPWWRRLATALRPSAAPRWHGDTLSSRSPRSSSTSRQHAESRPAASVAAGRSA